MYMEVRRLAEFDRWISRLRDRTSVLRITRRIARLEQGLLGDVKAIGDGLAEVRIDHGPGYRLYFIRRGSVLIILLCGGDKSTQQQDILRARLLAQDIEE